MERKCLWLSNRGAAHQRPVVDGEVGQLQQQRGRAVAAAPVHLEAQLPRPLQCVHQPARSSALLHCCLIRNQGSEKLHGAAVKVTRSWIEFLLEAAADRGSRRCKVTTKDTLRPCAHLDPMRIDRNLVVLDRVGVVDLLAGGIVHRQVDGPPVCLAAILIRDLHCAVTHTFTTGRLYT